MSDLADALTQYLAMRRTLGRVDRHVSRLLHHFVAFVDDASSPFITTDLVRRWAVQPADAHPSTWAERITRCGGDRRRDRAAQSGRGVEDDYRNGTRGSFV